MSIPTNGITAEVIRGVMPPYTLSTDLLEGVFRAVAPPPADATAAWRHARVARLVREVGGLMPADAPQARIAAEILIIREATDDTVARSHAPGLTVEQLCRLRRTAADLTRSGVMLERMLGRRQAVPAPFFGTVEADAVDIGALDAVWCKGTPAFAGVGVVQQGATPAPAADQPCRTAPVPGIDPGLGPVGPRAGDAEAPDRAAPPVRVAADPPAPARNQPDAAAPIVDTEAPPAVAPLPPAAAPKVRGRPDRSAGAAARPGRDTAAAPAWTTTRLDQGPSWTLDVVRPPKGGEPGGGAASTGS